MTTAELAFAAFGLTSQALLVAFFAARRREPRPAEPIGIAAYAFAMLGLPLAVWLSLGGQPAELLAGPLLLAAWAVFGASVDLWRPRAWRGPRVQWTVLLPYVGLYFLAQMFLWWPLWDIERLAWLAFLALFVANTALNIRGHLHATGV